MVNFSFFLKFKLDLILQKRYKMNWWKAPYMGIPPETTRKTTKMKYITILALTAAAFVSCQQQQTPAAETPAEPIEVTPVKK